MDIDCSKPLGEKLELYLKKDIDMICYELCKNGMVYESQFKSLWSMVCKNNAFEIMELLSKKTELDILYGYDGLTKNFMFYDENRYNITEAIKKSISYQKSKGNYY